VVHSTGVIPVLVTGRSLAKASKDTRKNKETTRRTVKVLI
jgi:hypothetical protein